MQQRKAFECVEGDLFQGWPEVGSRMMTRVCTGQDMVDGWMIVQEDVYTYCLIQGPPVIVRTVLNEYLATEVVWETDRSAKITDDHP